MRNCSHLTCTHLTLLPQVAGPLNLEIIVTNGYTVVLCVSSTLSNPGLNPWQNDGCAGVAATGDGSQRVTAYPGPTGTVYVVIAGAAVGGASSTPSNGRRLDANGRRLDATTVTEFTVTATPCGLWRANVTRSPSGGGNGTTTTGDGGSITAPAYARLFSVSAAVPPPYGPPPSSSATPLPMCYTCPPPDAAPAYRGSPVMLSTTGPLAGVCSNRCASDHEWLLPTTAVTNSSSASANSSGAPEPSLCVTCDASCWSCTGEYYQCARACVVDVYVRVPASLTEYCMYMCVARASSCCDRVNGIVLVIFVAISLRHQCYACAVDCHTITTLLHLYAVIN